MSEPGEGTDGQRVELTMRRTRLAQVLALVALAAAVLGAVVPAEKIRTTYTWPPRALPPGTPTRLWYSPLLLIRHEPESLAADIPCSPPRPLPAAKRPLTILSTARHPETAGGLAVRRAGTHLVFTIGDSTLDRESLRRGDAGEACVYRLRIGGGTWTLEDSATGIARRGTVDAMPVVTGLFSAVDLRAERTPSIEVTTVIHETRAILLQKLAWIIAVLGVAGALTVATIDRRPRGLAPKVGDAVRAASHHAHVTDSVVVTVLLGWLVLSPVFWDDGWVVARERAFSTSGGFSTYFNAFGVNLPLDYWVEWLQHWITESSASVPLMRLPALLCFVATWVLCRWMFVHVARRARGWSDAASWALAVSFLALVLAWGMTLRPEPVTALLATAVMACAVRFSDRGSTAPVAIAALLVPLALTAHHTGVVALAPVLAVVPQLFRWARRRPAAFVPLLTSSLALFVLLLFVGSDLGQRVADAHTTRQYGITQGWRDELGRYELLNDFPFGTPLRRGSVALILLAVLAYAVRRRRETRALFDLPTKTLTIALVLLVVTPSKLPWHFGALAGIATLAVAAETLRLREDAMRQRGWPARSLLVVGVAVVTAAWCWGPRSQWNPVDLRTIDWTPGLESSVPFAPIAILLPLFLLFAIVFLGAVRGRKESLPGAAGRVATWTAPMLATPLIVFTVGILAADFAKTSSWTLTRQNIQALFGNQNCGLAEDVLVPRLQSITSVKTAGDVATQPMPSGVPEPPVADLSRFLLETRGRASVTSPWFRLPEKRFGLFVAGLPDDSDELTLEWGRLGRGRIVAYGAAPVTFTRSDIETDPWSFLSASELPRADPRAGFFRVTLTGQTVLSSARIAVAPVTYENDGLVGAIASGSTLVHPNLLLYFPCSAQPGLVDGAVQPPRHIVWFDHPFQPHPFEATSTFLGLEDLYEVEQLPTSDSPNPPKSVVVFEVDETIPGARIAPPDRTEEVS